MKKRNMKKWIPHDFAYCYGIVGSAKNDACKWWTDITKKHIHVKTECDFSECCDENCSECDEQISYCKYLNKVEYGQYPLGDMCKICGVHINTKKAGKSWK
ncbi:MAG: hypothetical protein RR806_05085 [Oscillospiraceae bacterium]